ncbi:putative ankyrin repeat protein [Smittium mucronatum]|uniref:Putative ankyrin repeat protein n=1 Tax=Smittium mucronatum TaxID=133383 RepID=A0A1R0H4Y2_9FUNG|nr:putative ankyrin repeat protein [Smittium mucronatum]
MDLPLWLFKPLDKTYQLRVEKYRQFVVDLCGLDLTDSGLNSRKRPLEDTYMPSGKRRLDGAAIKSQPYPNEIKSFVPSSFSIPDLYISQSLEICCSTMSFPILVRSPLLLEERARIFSLVEKLVSLGIPPTGHKNLPLINSVIGDNPETVSLLLKWGADPNSNDGMATLLASSRGQHAILDLLLSAGAKPTSKAIKLAAKNKHWDIVGSLMESGVMPDSHTLNLLTMQ